MARKKDTVSSKFGTALHDDNIWLSMPEEPVLKCDIGTPLHLPTRQDDTLIFGVCHALREGTFYSPETFEYVHLKNPPQGEAGQINSVRIAAGHGLRLTGDREAFCEGILDQKKGSYIQVVAQKGCYVMATVLPVKLAGRGGYKKEDQVEYLDVSQIKAVTEKPVTKIGGDLPRPACRNGLAKTNLGLTHANPSHVCARVQSNQTNVCGALHR